jgi:HK97 family phage major capsid protein
LASTAELQKLHDLYRQAVTTSRDDNLPPETTERALADVLDLRGKLDQALIDSQREREVDDARAGLPYLFGGTAVRESPEVAAFLTPPTEDGPQKRRLMLPFAKRANEEWYKDTGSTVKAGYLYSQDMAGQVVMHENAESAVMLAGPSQINTPSGRDILYPTLQTDATANLTAERSPATITQPLFGQKTVRSHRIDGFFVLTMELQRDSEIDVGVVVAELAGRALGTKLASYVAVGVGTTEPEGLNTAASAGITAASQTTFSIDELIDLQLSVLPRARRLGSWIFGTDAYKLARKLKDGEGRYLLTPSIVATEPDLLLGRPVFEEATYPACTAGLAPITFGDVSRFLVRNVGPLVIERDDSVYFTAFETVVRFAHFFDSELLDTAAVKKLTLHA